MLSGEVVMQSLAFEYMGWAAGASHSCGTSHTAGIVLTKRSNLISSAVQDPCVAGQLCSMTVQSEHSVRRQGLIIVYGQSCCCTQDELHLDSYCTRSIQDRRAVICLFLGPVAWDPR